MKTLTLDRFEWFMTELNRKFPGQYPCRRQRKLGFLFAEAGVTEEWVNERFKYVMRSPKGKFDWEGAVRSFARIVMVKSPPSDSVGVALDVPGHVIESDYNDVTYQEVLDSAGARSAVEVLEKITEKRRQGETT